MKQYSGQIRCRKYLTYSGLSHTNKWKLTPYRYTSFNQATFVKMAAEDAGVTEEQMNAALKAYQTQFRQLLLNGHSINMGSLGTFRLSMSAKSAASSDDVTTDLIRRLRVIYTPSVQIKDGMKAINHIVDDIQYAYSNNKKFLLNRRCPIAASPQGHFSDHLQIVGEPNATAVDFEQLYFRVNGEKLEGTASQNSLAFESEHYTLDFSVQNGIATLSGDGGFAPFDRITAFGGAVKPSAS